jgi:thiamine-monophosphate kinase
MNVRRDPPGFGNREVTGATLWAMAWDEDRLHRWLARAPRAAVLAGAVGHDAAVLRPSGAREVACCDQVVLGIHVAEGTPLARVGAKAVARALSDLAATAASPRALLCALRAPRDAREADLRRVLGGVRREGEYHGAPLVGGDLTAGDGPLSLAVTALGVLGGAHRPPARSRARAGQRVILTGPVGGSLLGRHLRIRPPLEEGRALARAGAAALMDVSDGLAWDLHRLARSAGVRVVLEVVPIHADALRLSKKTGRPALDHALHDGEDHELIATLPAAKARRVLRDHPAWSDIGRVEPGRGLRLHLEGQPARTWHPAEGGWKHGR